ncbi:MAG: cupin domain-containing protein [Deferribacteraceae bacterium]|jgi:mannose-6-phosphate isomerase-like protein (cupin superfamily)|nr:cupin domain-containing protein [Deferribacteraceae bacterium]
MLIQRKEMKTETKEKMRAGEGSAHLTHIVDGEKIPHARLMAEITLQPGCSIGDHPHNNETEYFIILRGTGAINDNGVLKSVHPGDVVITGGGATHSIANTGDEDLVFHAIIILD